MDYAGLMGYANGTSDVRFSVKFPVPMRANPTFAGTSTACRMDAADDSDEFDIDELAIERPHTTSSPSTVNLIESAADGMTAGQGGQLEFRADSGKLEFDAEL